MLFYMLLICVLNIIPNISNNVHTGEITKFARGNVSSGGLSLGLQASQREEEVFKTPGLSHADILNPHV